MRGAKPAGFSQKGKKGHTMQDVMLPLIRKAELVQLSVNVAKAGLSMGDTAEVALMDAEQIGVFGVIRCHWLGLVPYRARRQLGQLGPAAREVLLPSLTHGDHLRVRIVGLTPEHLATNGRPEIHVSVWGDPARIMAGQTEAVAAEEAAAVQASGS